MAHHPVSSSPVSDLRASLPEVYGQHRTASHAQSNLIVGRSENWKAIDPRTVMVLLKMLNHGIFNDINGCFSTGIEAVDVPNDILKIKQEIDAELLVEDQTWGRNDANLQNQTQSRYSELDNRDWRSRPALSQPVSEERSWEAIRDNKESGSSMSKQDQWTSHKDQTSSSQGVGPASTLLKAEVPWSARRGNLSEKEQVLKTVKGILNKLTPEKFDLLKGQLIDSVITTPDILKSVIELIFDKAVLEPTFCPMYAQLCSELNESLQPFPYEEPGRREVTFRRILLDNCQEAFEGADNLRANI